MISVGDQIKSSVTQSYTHGRDCTSACRERAVPSTLARADRPRAWPCPFCGAPAGVACHLRAHSRQPLRRFGRCHPSRMEVAA